MRVILLGIGKTGDTIGEGFTLLTHIVGCHK